MDKKEQNYFSPNFDSYNIINLEQMDKFPYCFLGLVSQNNSIKSVGILIGEDIIITHFQELISEKEIISFMPFTTGEFKLYKEPIKSIKNENIELDCGINSNPLNLVVSILERKVGKEIIEMLNISSNEQFHINDNETRLYSFFKNNILFNEKNKKMRMNGFWEKKLLLLTYINPNKYFNIDNSQSTEITTFPESLKLTTTNLNLTSDDKKIKNNINKSMLEQQYFLICNKKLRNKISDNSGSFFNNDKDFIISQLKKKLRRCDNENIIQYEQANISRGSVLFIETNFGLCLLGLSTKLTKSKEIIDCSLKKYEKNDSIGITLTKNVFDIIEEKIKNMRNFINNNINENKNYFDDDSLFLNILEKDTLLVKGIFKKEITCDKILEIVEKSIEIPKEYLSFIIKNDDNDIIISNINSYLKLGEVIKEKSKIYYDIIIKIDVNNVANSIIESIKQNQNYENYKSNKNIQKILELVQNEMKEKKITNDFLYSLIFNNIIQIIFAKLK